MYSKEIDKKWQKYWQENEVYKFDKKNEKDIMYILEMFSYPSAAKLHVGHWFNYGPTDTFVRMKRMQGFNIFHPMGFDSFGLPAENYAIKTGVHPKDSTEQNILNMEKQLKEMGGSFDWNYEIVTSRPEYYKWTQWLFELLFEKGLAYKKEAPVNWCPSCNTVLANEQVVDEKCERCSTQVERRKMKQWFFKITDYAEELITGLDDLDWPEATKKIQKNWIGKSVGTEVNFKLEDGKDLTVFTTRADTLYGVTFIAIAPEGDLAKTLITEDNKKEAEKYINETIKVSEIERQFTDRPKTGVFTGSYAIHPLTGKKLPIYIADYVLENYANGAVMGVPAHDERDYEFAKKRRIEIIQVISENENTKLPYTEQKGKLINSDKFDGVEAKKAKSEITKYLEEQKIGSSKVQYKLKDWLVSRQRYWGSPIPIIHCDNCGDVLVPKDELPVELPYNVEFTPDGESPLAKCEEFVHTTCPKCGKPAKREVDTLDTFVCSSWYYLRYPFNKEKDVAFEKEKIDKYVPVDVYVGGKEHAAMHLIYSRFIYKVLRDAGYVKSDEPFKRLKHQGLILGPDGNKMSKSKGNTIAPDEYVDKYGSDVLRMYMMFANAYSEGGAWSDEAVVAMKKYIARIENLKEKIYEGKEVEISEKDIKSLEYIINSNIISIKRDVEDFSFNTAIARIMEITNEMYRIVNKGGTSKKLKEEFKKLIIILAPFAPHLSEELWHQIGEEGSVHKQEYPKEDNEKIILDNVTIAIQINGKLRETIEIKKDEKKEKVLEEVKKLEKIIPYIEGKHIIKEIYVPNKIVNIVVK